MVLLRVIGIGQIFEINYFVATGSDRETLNFEKKKCLHFLVEVLNV